ncbi:MAG: aminotransferase class V-fold PLP-dependent enzyme [Melioribacteraceae bacterium]|nr:aminotransferase class V-fold PLP-dependent enzyme [Melioribacteraceae bacterium]
MDNFSELQGKIFNQFRAKDLFEEVQSIAYSYLDQIFNRHVFPEENAIQALEELYQDLGQGMSDASDILKTLSEIGSPATSASLGGRYFGFVTGSAMPIGIAVKTLATYWDQNAGLGIISPICATLESVVEGWFKQIFNLPESSCAGFVSGTSTANFCALAAARYHLLKKLDWDINEKGLNDAPKLRIITGKHAHSTVIKAISLLGFGKENIEWVDVDEQGRIDVVSIPELDEKSILILQAGNVNSGAFDNFEIACKKASKTGAWTHIDGAFGLWAAASEKLKYLTRGIEFANSWALDAHKTLNTPYDSGIVLCADEKAMVSALHMTGSYIIESDTRDGMYYTPEMSRRSRVLELWAIMKFLGKEGIDMLVYGLHERAVYFGKELNQLEGFKILNQIVFNQIIICCETDELTEYTLKNIQEQRVCWVGGSSWFGKKVIRISVCSWATSVDDIDKSVGSFKNALNKAIHDLSQ